MLNESISVVSLKLDAERRPIKLAPLQQHSLPIIEALPESVPLINLPVHLTEETPRLFAGNISIAEIEPATNEHNHFEAQSIKTDQN